MSKDKSGSEIALGCVASLAATPLLYLLNGYVLLKLWFWFIVPVFHLPGLSMAEALGLAIVVGFLTHHPRGKEEREWYEVLTKGLFQPLWPLIAGWIIKAFL